MAITPCYYQQNREPSDPYLSPWPTRAGKTTLAKQLAAELNLPLISKDDIKVKLFDVYGWKDRAESRKAGSASYTIIDYIIEAQLRVGNSLIFESTFTPALDNKKFQNWQQQYGV